MIAIPAVENSASSQTNTEMAEGPTEKLVVVETAEALDESQVIWEMAERLVDEDWYLKKYQDVALSGMDPKKHYMTTGFAQRYDPSPLFWTQWYLEKYPDVAAANLNPLLHFVSNGASEGRDPSPIFDLKWYRDHYSDVVLSGKNPLLHYMTIGEKEGRASRPDFAITNFCTAKSAQAIPPITRIQTAALKLKMAGTEGFYQAQLWSGRDYQAHHGGTVKELGDGALGKQLLKDVRRAGAFKRNPYLTQFDDAIVIPGSATVIPDDEIAINDEVLLSSSGKEYETSKAWDKIWANNGQILIKYRIDITPTIDSGIHLFKEYEQNYFHFTCELATKLHLIETDNLVPIDAPILISDDLDKRIYELVDSIKNPLRQIIKLKRDIPYNVKRLFYISDISKILDGYDKSPDETTTFISDSIIQSLSKHMRIRFQSTRDRKSRFIYLARTTDRRTITNQAEVIESLIDIGFETVSLDHLNIASQVKLLSESKAVIGPTGAAFTNLMWCAPRTRVLILYPDHPLNNRTFWDVIGKALKLEIEYYDGPRTGDIQGRYAMHDSFSVDVGEVAAIAERLTRRSKATTDAN
ncbi:glycosyltransferase family 61 protein [Phyllobacterium myrsinacearum]|uniref:glycosyltransferase family 61 protein n=1 Tax=Phyllobacterium myrsinacearum TaxID=28101 RepID=UPI0013EEA3F0|nr:glycosyltransferase family 61 protein [Phyllobacterium myrsinacearum]